MCTINDKMKSKTQLDQNRWGRFQIDNSLKFDRDIFQSLPSRTMKRNERSQFPLDEHDKC